MNRIKIVYDGGNERFAEAVVNANSILGSGNLLAIIENRKEKFFNTDRTCQEIAQAISECNVTIAIKLFTRGEKQQWYDHNWLCRSQHARCDPLQH